MRSGSILVTTFKGLIPLILLAAVAVTIIKQNQSTLDFSSGVENEDAIVSPNTQSENNVAKSRKKRAIVVNLSAAEIQAILDKHNELRRGEGASDMEEMIWNNDIAEMAQEWADGCNFNHGNPTRDPAPFSYIGQNLWGSSASTRPTDLTSPVQSWFDEKADYNYDTLSCSAVCGHYTQVVWANSRHLGCGFASCPSSPKQYLVCNYGPGGNFGGQKPYQKGYPCTQCQGSKFCNNDLCQPDCTAEGAGCECKALCQNCGTVTASCECECEDGWVGEDCTTVCEDTDSRCNNGWYSGWCVPERDYVLNGCPAMCGLCVNVASPLTCPVVTPAACGEWGAWNTGSCKPCGGCGLKSRTRDCGANGIEKEGGFCEAKYCLRGVNDAREWLWKKSPWTGRWRRIGRNRRCCYDYRWGSPKRLHRDKICIGRRVQGWQNA